MDHLHRIQGGPGDQGELQLYENPDPTPNANRNPNPNPNPTPDPTPNPNPKQDYHFVLLSPTRELLRMHTPRDNFKCAVEARSPTFLTLPR